MSVPVELSTLRLGPELGSGGQATVYELIGRADVLKLYHQHTPVHWNALAELIDWRKGISEEHRRLLDARACWPTQLVTDGGTAVGCTLPRLPDRFFVKLSTGHVRPREFQYLSRPARSAKLGIATPKDSELARLCRDYAEVFDVLDRNGVVFGDISERNLLWALDPEPAVFLIDCDGACLDGHPPALAPVTTVGWNDPSQPQSSPDRMSDRYKLGLVIGRAIFGDPDIRPLPGQRDFDSASTRLGPDLALLLERSLSGLRVMRPSAADWVDGLGRRGSREFFVGSRKGSHRRRRGRLSRRRSRQPRPNIAVARTRRRATTAVRPVIAVAPAAAKPTGRHHGPLQRPQIPVGAAPRARRVQVPRPAAAQPPKALGALAAQADRTRSTGRNVAIAMAVAIVTAMCVLAIFASVAQAVSPAWVPDAPRCLRAAERHAIRAVDVTGIYGSAVAPPDEAVATRKERTTERRAVLTYDARTDVLDLVFGGGTAVDFGEYVEDVFVTFDDSATGKLLSLHARSATRLRSRSSRESLSNLVGPSVWRRTLGLSASGASARESLPIPEDEWRLLREKRWPPIHQQVREALGPESDDPDTAASGYSP